MLALLDYRYIIRIIVIPTKSNITFLVNFKIIFGSYQIIFLSTLLQIECISTLLQIECISISISTVNLFKGLGKEQRHACYKIIKNIPLSMEEVSCFILIY